MTDHRGPAGMVALSIFFAFGALMSGITLFLLLFPGSLLEPMWRLNPRAHQGFAAMGSSALLLMIMVCLACTVASVGLWRGTRWGYWIALTILSVNLLGDTANAILAHDWRTLIGLPIGALMIAYLLKHRHVLP